MRVVACGGVGGRIWELPMAAFSFFAHTKCESSLTAVGELARSELATIRESLDVTKRQVKISWMNERLLVPRKRKMVCEEILALPCSAQAYLYPKLNAAEARSGPHAS